MRSFKATQVIKNIYRALKGQDTITFEEMPEEIPSLGLITVGDQTFILGLDEDSEDEIFFVMLDAEDIDPDDNRDALAWVNSESTLVKAIEMNDGTTAFGTSIPYKFINTPEALLDYLEISNVAIVDIIEKANTQSIFTFKD